MLKFIDHIIYSVENAKDLEFLLNIQSYNADRLVSLTMEYVWDLHITQLPFNGTMA